MINIDKMFSELEASKKQLENLVSTATRTIHESLENREDAEQLTAEFNKVLKTGKIDTEEFNKLVKKMTDASTDNTTK